LARLVRIFVTAVTGGIGRHLLELIEQDVLADDAPSKERQQAIQLFTGSRHQVDFTLWRGVKESISQGPEAPVGPKNLLRAR
jgi:nucleoside-diphosphate-sugar epimerase